MLKFVELFIKIAHAILKINCGRKALERLVLESVTKDIHNLIK